MRGESVNLNADEAWSGNAGDMWSKAQPIVDALFQPIDQDLVDWVRPHAPRRILDVGCGAGSTLRTLTQALGVDAAGIDVSAAQLEVARQQANAERLDLNWLHGDAQHHEFERGEFDLLVSRFGLMFFEQPVAAFENLRHATRTGGLLAAVAWRGMAHNPFMTAAEAAAAAHLPGLPARADHEPGQFAFADEQRVRAMLQQAGWQRVHIVPVEYDCVMPESDLVRYFSLLGPVARALTRVDAPTREKVTAHVRDAFQPFVHGNQVRFSAACWKIQAQA